MTDDALNAHNLNTDVVYLRRIGKERGFPPRLRRKIWTILLDCESEERPTAGVILPHQDEKQVLLDTNRSFTMALPHTIEESQIFGMKIDLQHLIAKVLRNQPWLHYYQGYHDIAQLFYLVMGNNAGPALESLSLFYLRDFMLSSLDPSMSMLRLVHQIVQVAEPEYAVQLHDVVPYYAIPVLLTWWTHSIESHDEACRMFDFLLSSEPVMIIYTIAAATLLRQVEVLKLDGDPDMIFLVLSRGIAGLNLEELLRYSTELYRSIKPHQLPYWKNLSIHSCLKTSSEAMLQDGKPVAGPQDEPLLLQTYAVRAKAHSLHFEAELKREKESAALETEKQKQRKNKQEKMSGTEVKKLSLLALGIGFLAVGIAWFVQHRDPP
ncbi:protein of unknown function [Taphrina deformans PYCC 5710]|uniref:Rab-GAP TBC domain-containing protein n=1 Tax=Taphrina deformans (strain PYCC 5710 / ATCC 11124 / CBS 356.35 / IMI 108563 / JCM 9778 / NBRC 8474) TaxID=1097556 RepID=R4XN49_TAPDE|nr:protein of unknown function [Taphrina deformans PYCC 5710]|eukprot:CCG84669.1 protein of unknown function [Taphrina deformans PYCC 5710]